VADTKISALSAVSSVAGANEFAVNESGTSKKATATQVRTFVVTPTVPSIVSVGAEFTSTGAPTATLPGTHAANDILVLVLQSSNENIATPSGYQQLGPQNGIGASATAASNRLGIFWKRDGGSESAPTIADSGDHTYGMMFAVRGCPTTGDPFVIGGNNFKTTTSTTGTGPKSVTFIDNTLVVDIFAGSADNASAEGSSLANTDLSSVAEQFDDGTTDGTGGFIYVASGTKATAGEVKATTVTWANTSVDLCTRIHFLPSDMTQMQLAAKPAEIQIFTGSAPDLDDTWVKPTGARRVTVQAIGGGGSGSSGHTATTPSGGGGGGGGHYTERAFNAADLSATVTTHAGKGGAATSVAVDQAGNNGTNSTFGTTLVVAVAGTGASAAASADGGNGGSGGGTTVPAANSVQTIAAGELGTAGGNGSTTGVGGSPGEHGGGGGASGTTAANTTVTAGLSKYVGGGGGAGANTGTLTAGGAGGGAAAPGTSPSTSGTDSSILPYGGSGGTGGNATTAPGGTGGFPGGGGAGGGGNNASTQGGRGGHGCIVVTTFF